MAIFLVLDLFIYNVTPYKIPSIILGIPLLDSPVILIIYFTFLAILDWHYLINLVIILSFFNIDKILKKHFKTDCLTIFLRLSLYYFIYILLSKVFF